MFEKIEHNVNHISFIISQLNWILSHSRWIIVSYQANFSARKRFNPLCKVLIYLGGFGTETCKMVQLIN